MNFRDRATYVRASGRFACNPARRRGRRGAAAVEFVLTLPVLMLILVGSIEFGNYFSRVGTLTDLVQDAARFGAKQERAQLALSLSAAATEQLLDDLGFSCSSCVTTRMLTLAGRNYLFVEVVLPYEPVTGILPAGVGGFGFAPPVSLRARAIYPQR